MRKRMLNPLKLKDILPKAFQKMSPDNKVIIWALQEKWSQIVGDSLGRQSFPVSLTRGYLQIGVKSSALANELSMMQSAVLEKVREEIPSIKIYGVRFQLHTSSSR